MKQILLPLKKTILTLFFLLTANIGFTQDLKPILNCTSSPTQCLTERDHVKTGGYYWFSFGAENIGSVDAGSGSTKVYFSRDTIWDVNDVLIHSEQFGTIDKYETSIQPSELQLISPSLGTGIYYLLAVVDTDNEVIETDESNNVSFQEFLIVNEKPDLIVTYVRSGDTINTKLIPMRV